MEELIARGRDADIFAVDEHRVRRRSRTGRAMLDEARTMQYVVDHGYACPRVEWVSDDGLEMVMERVYGPTMIVHCRRHPFDLRAIGRQLRGLHDRLHQIPAAPWHPPAPVAPGPTLVHLDLHPLNVLMSPQGPVVVDWVNAAAGRAEVDVVAAWVLLAAGVPDGGALTRLLAAVGRRAMVAGFLAPDERAPLGALLADWVRHKSADTNMSRDEVATMVRLVERYRAPESPRG